MHLVVASLTALISFGLSSIQIGRDCHYFQMGSGTAAFALMIGVIGQAAAACCDRWVVGAPVDEGPSPRRISEAESQGIEETVINGAETQGIEETVINGSNGAETQKLQITDP